MYKSIGLFFIFAIVLPASANTFYKCIKGDKVVYSYSICPTEYKQLQMAYQNGVTTKIDSDDKTSKVDPLKALLNDSTVPHDKLIQLISAEILRLKQEIRYNEISKASELKKIERDRFWSSQDAQESSYKMKIKKVNQTYNELNELNHQTISNLTERRDQLEQQIKQ